MSPSFRFRSLLRGCCAVVLGLAAVAGSVRAQSDGQERGTLPADAYWEAPPSARTLAAQALDRIRFERSDALTFAESNFITTHLLDRHGFVWMASEGNLFRFDGYTLRTYGPDPADPNSLPSDVIYGIA
ncbi:MAG: hypothetical protein AAF809_10275, partial [Bacteroidota bacterium]